MKVPKTGALLKVVVGSTLIVFVTFAMPPWCNRKKGAFPCGAR